MTAHLLDDSFDVSRLQRDLAAVERRTWIPQPGIHHRGEWTGLSLVSAGGREDTAAPFGVSREEFKPTPLLEVTPYLREVLDALPCPKLTVRLLRLPPGGRIIEHADLDVSVRSGGMRLHLPIVTHDDVDFRLGGVRQRWAPGQLWYGDFSLPHSVENRSPITRVHLVIDVACTEALLSWFPTDVVARWREDGIALVAPAALSVSAEQLKRYACRFVVPAGVLGDDSTAGAVTLEGDTLVATLDGMPPFALEPLADGGLAITGLPPGFRLNCDFDGEQMVAATLMMGTDAVPVELRR
ncbi:MAG: aspartyl/asparaginyl beta-hydroxylase domain-containing protein [Myxococcaceae bacterium]|nr:aspartyl/asparaginyl beta-hydroxylase domain-containing protein [Myxococcaceae bacterium]